MEDLVQYLKARVEALEKENEDLKHQLEVAKQFKTEEI